MFLLNFLLFCSTCSFHKDPAQQLVLSDEKPTRKEWVLNTSNPGKLQEFQRLFSQYGVSLNATKVDQKEIQADALTVAVHKASQMPEGVLVEDTSLDVEGASIGVNVRWLLDHLSDYVGKKAWWSVLLAYREGKHVYVYRGQVQGTIVKPRGTQGFGFDPLFQPDGSDKTLAEFKPDSVNARALAVQALMKGQRFAVQPVIEQWTGSWQH